MTRNTDWILGADAWEQLVNRHPELGYRPGFWALHNFLRLHRKALIERDAIRKARGRWWIAHVERFPVVAFQCATGISEEKNHG